MDTVIEQESNGYGKEFLLKIFKDLESDHEYNKSYLKHHKEKAQNYIKQLEDNNKKISELTTTFKNSGDQFTNSLLEEEITRLKFENDEFSKKIEYQNRAVNNFHSKLTEFKNLQEELVSLGILEDNL